MKQLGEKRPMDAQGWLTERFEANRTHLKAVAYRMLGSLSEADDAVQESWLRLSRADAAWHPGHARMADDCGRACLPRYAPRAEDATGRSTRRAEAHVERDRLRE
jgi:hypothetical protein